MFDVIITNIPRTIDTTSVLLTCLAGNLTIFAFGYPYIYRAINNLTNISSILSNRGKNNRYLKYYPIYITIVFILNIVSLVWFYSIIWCICSLILLLVHIFYIMGLYHYIETKTLEPFNLVINKNGPNQGLTIKNNKEFENDINLVLDLICYAEKITINEPDLNKYFEWLKDATLLNFKSFDDKKFDFLFGIKRQYYNSIFCTLYKIQWLNQWAVDNKKTTTLYYISNFFEEILKNKAIITNKTNNTNWNEVTKVIQSRTLEYLKQVILYRIKHEQMLNSEMEYFVNLIYFVLLDKLNSKQSDKFEPCFSIITKMIDFDISEEYYHQIIIQIQNNHNYFNSKKDLYYDICNFHINVMAYFMFKHQYHKLKSYMHYEEPPERTTEHTRPQIPNSINPILLNFIGNDSVFYNTQTFSVNVSSSKYKFYVLFLLLINSKKFAERANRNLSKINKTNFQYKFIKKDLKRHTTCSIDFNKIPFDNLMSYISIESYKEYLTDFSQEIELLNLFKVVKKNDIAFIDKILSSTIKKIKNAQKNLLKSKFKKIAKLEFSLYKQKELKVKNLRKLINRKIARIYKSLENITFSSDSVSELHDFYLCLYDKTYNKKQILSGQYQYIFDREPITDFYTRLFNLLITHCKKVDSIENLSNDTIERNYQILSNFDKRQAFSSFGFNIEDIKVKTCIVDGIEEKNSDFADVNSIKINDKELIISQYNNHFNTLNNNGTPYTIIIFDPQKISIEVGEKQSIKFIDINRENVKIQNNTQIKIRIPNDTSLGYCIINKKNKQN